MMLKSILRSFSYEHLKTVHFGNAHALTAFIEVRHLKGSSKCKVRAIEGSTNPNDLHLSLPPSAVLQKEQIFLRAPFYPVLQLVS